MMISEEAIGFIQKSFKKGNVVCITGAEISAESGIPALKVKGPLWDKYRPEIYATTMGLVSTFQTSPEKIVDFLNDFYPILIKARPNPAHLALAVMEKQGLVKALITQNIDGLHQQAGSRSVIELNGNAYRIRCMNCLKTVDWERDRIKEMVNLLKRYRASRMQLLRILSRYFPKCKCLGRFRIDVVLFGEILPQEALSESYRVLDDCNLLLLIGASLVGQPATTLPSYAKQKGAKIVEINNQPSDLACDLKIQGKAVEIVPQILNRL